MYDKFIVYDDIIGQEDVLEEVEPRSGEVDKKISQDLAMLFQIREEELKTDSLVEVRKRKIDNMYNLLHHKYNMYGERNDDEYRKNRSKKILKNIKWDKEICLTNGKDKLDVFLHIQKSGLIIDKCKYEEGDECMTCLSVIVCHVDYNNDDPIISIQPDFVFNKVGNIQPQEDATFFEINLDDIKEVIVDNIRYTFPL